MELLSLITLDLDPSVVKPGWTPLLITIAMAGALVLLFRSMRRQFSKINVPGSTPPAGDADSAEPDPPQV